jgi:hypothetical protein
MPSTRWSDKVCFSHLELFLFRKAMFNEPGLGGLGFGGENLTEETSESSLVPDTPSWLGSNIFYKVLA